MYFLRLTFLSHLDAFELDELNLIK